MHLLPLDCARISAQSIAVPATVAGSTLGATREANEKAVVSGAVTYQSIWYSFTAVASRVHTISTASSTFDTVLSVNYVSGSYSASLARMTQVRRGRASVSCVRAATDGRVHFVPPWFKFVCSSSLPRPPFNFRR